MFYIFIIRPLLEASGSHISLRWVCYYLWANPSRRLILPSNHKLTHVISRRFLNCKQDVMAYPRRRFSWGLTRQHSSDGPVAARPAGIWMRRWQEGSPPGLRRSSRLLAALRMLWMCQTISWHLQAPTHPYLYCKSKVSELGLRGAQSSRVFCPPGKKTARRAGTRGSTLRGRAVSMWCEPCVWDSTALSPWTTAAVLGSVGCAGYVIRIITESTNKRANEIGAGR